MSQYSLKKMFPERIDQEILILYNLGLDAYEIEYLVNLRMREVGLKLKD